MYNDIEINVVGNVVTDPQLRETADGTPVVSFRIACNSRRWDRDSDRWVDGASSYFQVSCWRELARNVVRSVVKGHPVLVQGHLTQRVLDRDGRRTTFTDIEARAIGHDLGRGSAQFARTSRGHAAVAAVRSSADAA